MKDLSNAN